MSEITLDYIAALRKKKEREDKVKGEENTLSLDTIKSIRSGTIRPDMTIKTAAPKEERRVEYSAPESAWEETGGGYGVHQRRNSISAPVQMAWEESGGSYKTPEYISRETDAKMAELNAFREQYPQLWDIATGARSYDRLSEEDKQLYDKHAYSAQKYKDFYDEMGLLGRSEYRWRQSAKARSENLVGTPATIFETVTDAATGGSMDKDGFAAERMRNAQEANALAMQGLSTPERMAYGAIQSAIDMGVNTLLTGGKPLNLMALQAGAGKAYDVQADGGSAMGGLVRGTAAAAFERLLESPVLDELKDIATGVGGKGVVSDLLKTAADEGLEEGASYVLNYLADILAKDPNASFSIGELLENIGTGALSGGLMGAGAKAVGTVRTNARNAELGSEIQQAGGVEGVVEQAKSSGDAALMKLAKEVASGNGKNVQRNIGKLANETASFYAEKADNAEYDAIYKGVETRLRELGEDANAPALAEIITDRFVNPQHKDSDNAPVNENANAKTVMGEMLSTGKHRPEWVTAVTEEASSQRKSAGDSLAFVSAARVNTAVEANGVKTRLAGIVENDDGETVAKLSTGETAPIASIAFASPETEMLYKQAERLGFKAATADNFVKMYTGGDPVQYAEDYTRVYSIGKSGAPIAQAFKLAGELDITSPTIRAAYLAGQIEADQSAKAKQADLDAAKETFAKAGIAGKKGSVDTSVLVGMELTEQQKASVQAVKRIAEVLGINAKFVMSEVDESGNRVGKNGSYNRVTNAFEFDIWAGSNTVADTNVAIIRTVAHELTHYIQKWSPAQYKNLKSFLLRQYSNDALEALVADKMRVAEANGITLSYEDAVDEVVADACEMMLRDSTAINTLAKENRTLFDHIRGWLKNVSDAMRKAFSGVQANSLEARILESNLEAMQQVQKMWDDALVDASKADKAASHIGVNIVNQTVPGVDAPNDGIPKAVTSSFAASKGTQYCTRSLLEADNKFIMPIGGNGKPKFLREKGKVVRKSGLQVTLDVAEANGVPKTQRDRIERELKSMAQLLKEAAATYRFIGLNDVNNAKLLVDAKSGTVVLSAMVKNGDYPVNFDLTKICKKREAMSKFVDALSNRKGRNGGETLLDEVNLSQGDLWKINTILRDAGYETACLGCFVESKRYNIEQWATSFVEKWNGVVDKIAPNAGYFDFSKKEVGVSDLSLSDIDRLTKLLTKPAKDKGSLKNRMSNTKAEKAKSVADEIKSIKENGLTMDYILRMQESQNTESETYKKSKAVGDKKIAYFMERLTGGEAVTDADIKYLRDKGILRGSNLSNLEKIDVLVASDGAFQKKLRVQDLITPQGITNLTALSTEFAGIVSGHYGSGTPKFAQGFAPYNSEIALLPDKAGKTDLRDYLYKIAGARMQSFSDFKIENVLDYMQMIADLSIRNLPAHAYTKEIAFARLFGKTGMKINLSVMFDIDPSMGKEYAGLTRDADGNLVYLIGDKARSDAEYERTGKRTFVQSIGFDEAVALQNEDGYSSNVCIIGVGYSNAHILMMLDDERFRYIIPYHKSGLPTEISEATHIEFATDYTSVQNTLELKGIVDADGKTVRFDKAKWFSDKYAELGNWSDVMTAFNQYIEKNGYRVDTVKADAGHGKFYMYQDLAKTKDPKKTCQNYIGWCLHNDMFPMFYEFAGHENYYKMNFDFGMYDTITGEYAPQGDVQFNFPDDLHELVHEYMLAQNEANRFAEENFEPTLDAIYNTIKKPAMQELARFEVKPVSRKAGEYDIDAAELSDANTQFSIRQEPPPRKTGIAYKVFFAKDGKLYPPMVANPGGEGTPIGVWLNADVGQFAGVTKTGRMQVKAGGKGTQGGSGTLAFRPGWHLGDIPLAKQFARMNPETGAKDLFPENFIWAECEYAMDIDYQEEAMSYGYNANGKFQHSYAGLPKIPENGYYRYRTNPNPDTVPWIITGAMKVIRILDDSDVAKICHAAGVEPMQRKGGNINLERYGFKAGSVNAEQNSLRDSTGKQLVDDDNKVVASGRVSIADYKNLFDTWNEDTELQSLADVVFGKLIQKNKDAEGSPWKQQLYAHLYSERDLKRPYSDKAPYGIYSSGVRSPLGDSLPYGIYINVDAFNDATVYTDNQKRANTILHEAIHAITHGAIAAAENNLKNHKKGSFGYVDVLNFEAPDSWTDEVRGGLALLQIYEQFDSSGSLKAKHYGFKDAHEMVAELSNPDFRNELKKRSLWDTVVDAIKKILGIKPGNALDATTKALEQILGEPIAQSATNSKPTADPDIRYSLRSATDENYLDAVARGDMETAQLMVDEAAKNAGYPEKLYHGTQRFGFTVTDTDKSDDKLSFFATNDIDTAKTYSSVGGVRPIGGEVDYDALYNAIEEAKSRAEDSSGDVADSISRWAGYYNFVDGKYIHDKLSEITDRYSSGNLTNEDAYNEMYEFLTDVLADGYSEDAYDGQEFWEWQESDEAEELYTEVNKTIAAYLSAAEIEMETSGNYALYANTDGLLVIDFNGSKWDKLQSDLLPDITSEEYNHYGYRGHRYDWTTRSVAKYAKDMGYKGVCFKNIYDDGGKAYGSIKKPADVYVFFDPQSQVKSADPITYDDAGNVIPLSERFNSGNKDIRYSLRDQAFVRAEQKLADDIYYGQKLSESRDKQDAKIKEIRSRYEKKIADIRETNKDKRKALRAEYKAKMEAEVAEVRKTHYAVETRIREQYKAKLEAEVENRRESLKGYREDVKARDLRKRIKKYRDDMKNRVLRPTDNKYVPSHLIDGAIAVADLLQEATLSAEGTKARAKQESIRSALYDLKAQYDQLKADRDPSYQFEYDEEFSDKISELAQALGKKTVSEMSYEELQDVYTILKDIRETITGATRLIVKNEAYTTYEMGAKIIDEINASRGRTNLWNQFVANEVMSPLIAVRRMNDYNEDAGLVKLFDALNEGTRKADRFTMESHQMFDALRTGKDNLQAFNDAVNEKVTLPFTDSEGNEIKASKMQVMQILLSWQREVSSDGKMSHLTKGGVVIPDSKLLEKGDVRAAVSKGQRTGALTIEQIDSLMDLLSDWDKDFMRTAHRFFNVKAKQAINEATIETKHREIALSKDYIPFSVDKDFTPGAEITGLKYDNTINGMGMLKSIVQNAGQPLVIHGLNQVVDRHIADTAKVYGLSVPVKNLNKVLAVQKPGYTESVRSAITKKYHGEGIKLIENAIRDIQSPRTRENNAVNRMLNKLNTAFIKNALVANISVTIKQSSSYFVAGRYISMPVLAKHYGEVLKVFGNTNSDYAQRLFAEIDEHTAAHWIRRQGLAFSEFSALSQDKGVYGKLEAYLRDKPSLVNALSWIQNMDVATTAAMWNACKEEVENTLSLKEGDKGYWEAVTDLYNKAVEETQSTYDSLHRGELLKGTDGLLRSLVLFQTEPMKHSAMLYAAGEKMQIMRAKGDSEGLKQAKQEFSDLTKSLLISQIAFVLMTLLSRIVLHKMNSYREEDTGDVTAKSVLTGSGKELAENAIGIAVPLVGNYLPDIIGLVTGNSKYDAFSVPTVDLMNDIVSSVSKVSNDPSMENLGKLVLTAGGLVGIPAQNLWNIVKGASLHMEDAVNGEFAKFEAGYDRTGAQYVASASELFKDGKRDAGKAKVSEFIATKKADYVADGYSDEEAEKKAKSAVKTALTNYYKPLYLAASEKERAEIRKTMWAFGVYSSTDDVVKKCNDWLRK